MALKTVWLQIPTPLRVKHRKHFSMLRGFHLADFFTLANAACGVATRNM